MKQFLQSMVNPRWKRGDAKSRRRAVKELDDGDNEILLDVVFTDEDESVRLAACRKLEGVEALETVVQQSSCDAVKDLASTTIRRIRKEAVLSAGEDDWQEPLANVKHDECLAEIVTDTDNHELRMAAVERITSHDALMTVVTSGCGKDAGLKALERLDGEEVLKEIAEKGGNKAVRHEAASRLEAMLAPDEPVEEEPQIDVPAELQALVDYAESIKETYNFDGVSKVLAEKVAAWNELDPNLESPLYPRFQELAELFQKRRDEFAEKQAEQARFLSEQQALSESKDAIVQKLAALKPQDEGVAESLDTLKEEWGTLASLADEDAEEACQRSFTRAVEELQSSMQALSREADQKAAIEAKVSELEAALESDDESALHANKKKTWKQPDWRFNDPEPLKQRFNKALKAINEKLDLVSYNPAWNWLHKLPRPSKTPCYTKKSFEKPKNVKKTSRNDLMS